MTLFEGECLKGLPPSARDYIGGRIDADRRLVDIQIPIGVVRIPIAFTDIRQDGAIDTGHSWGFEQIARLPLHPYLGSGEQFVPIVYDGDVAKALVNGAGLNETITVDAVSPDRYTQLGLQKYFVSLAGGTHRPVRIPYEAAMPVAVWAPSGRFAAYNVVGMRALEDKERAERLYAGRDFEALTGPLTSLGDIYRKGETDPDLLASPPPIGEHVKDVVKAVRTNPVARREIGIMVIRHGIPICVDAIKASRL